MGGERIIAATAVQRALGPIIVAPSQYLLTGNERLRLRLWCLAFRSWPANERVFRLIARTVRRDGSYQVGEQDVVPTSDSLVRTAHLALEPGALQSALVAWSYIASTTTKGLAYAILDFVQGTTESSETVIGTLCAGYIGAALPLTWPGTPIRGPYDGPGYVDTSSEFAFVGDEWVHTTGLNRVERVLSVAATYIADATAVARRPRLQATINGARVGLFSSPQDITAGQTVTTTWMPGAALGVGGALQDGIAPMPAGLILRRNDTLSTSTLTRQVGDQYNSVVVTSEFFLEPLL